MTFFLRKKQARIWSLLTALLMVMQVVCGTLWPAIAGATATPGTYVVQNVQAAGGNLQVQLTWDAVASATAYNVYRASSQDGDKQFVGSVTAPTWSDVNVVNGTKYYYFVTAQIDFDVSPFSNYAAATPSFPIQSVVVTQSSTPVTLGAGNTTSEIQVTLNIPGLTNNPALTGMEAPNLQARLFYYMEGTNQQYALDTNLQYKADDGSEEKIYWAKFEPRSAITYYYFAKVSTDNGETWTASAQSYVDVYGDPNDTTAPEAPVLASINAESKQAQLNWTENAADVYQFEIYRQAPGEETFRLISVQPNTALSYMDNAVSNGTQYIYIVAAVDAFYNRAYSTEKSVTPKAASVSGIAVTSESVTDSVYVGSTLHMSANVTPSNATDKSLAWSIVGGTGSASIDPMTGDLTGTGVGTVMVRAAAKDGSGVYDEHTITIVGVPVSGLSVSSVTYTVYADSTLHLGANVTPSNATNQSVTWSIVGGTGSASIDPVSGLLTASGLGEVIVRVIANDGSGVYGEHTITVMGVPVSIVSVTSVTYAVHAGSTLAMQALVGPDNAANKNMDWSVDNTDIASIDANGLLTGKAPGSVTVKATAADGSGVYGVKSITVLPQPITVVPVSNVTVTAPKTNLNIGDKLQLTAAVLPANATNHTVSWSVYSGQGVASVDANGVVTALSAGAATVKATSTDGTNLSSKIDLIVSKQVAGITITSTSNLSSVYVGDMVPFLATVNPDDATDKAVSWSVTSGSGSATINANGLLTASSAGTVTVMATARDGSGKVGTSTLIILAHSSGSESSSPTNTTTTTPTIPDQPNNPTPAPPAPSAPLVITLTLGKPAFNLNDSSSVETLRKILLEKLNSSNATVEFKDTANHWASEGITVFAKLGVINGYGDGTFKPNANITRGEFATLVAKMFNIGSGTAQTVQFKDVDGNWSQGSIMALASNGILNGYGDGTFRPDNNITRAEMVAIVARIFDMNIVKENAKSSFSDIENAWNKDQIQAAAKAGVINGEDDSSFAPSKNTTRAEAITVLLRSMKLSPEIAAFLNSIK